ncbi:MAG TPA: hypothetical protein VK100_03885 [Pseudogracilibacillus sp.]|nr:hypothetical protein [Pseudogracilibacillus sp.]
MNNKYLTAMFMGVITFIATYVILSRDEKEKNESFDLSMEKAGIPDQIESKEPTETENANMVSEGSQFGVQYYNHLPESKKEELQEN